MYSEVLNQGQCLLEQNYRESVHLAVEQLAKELYSIKYSKSPSEWQQVIKLAKSHSVQNILTEGLQVQHSQHWPRGYPGDAEMLDLIYGLGDTGVKLAKTTSRGRFIEEYCYGSLVQVSARRRLKRIANLIDSLCYRQSDKAAHILSIACGYLREGHISKAVAEKRFGRFVALDQDAESIEVVKNNFANLGIETITDSLGVILKKRIDGAFDFVYAAGLYDYLPKDTAAQLTAAMFDLLNPGGRLLVANYTPKTPEAGFMEAFMNWPLIYRTEQEIAAFGSLIDNRQVASVKIFPEIASSGQNCLLYLELIKK